MMNDNDKIQNRYLKICEMTSEDEIDVMSDGESNVRDYEVGDYVNLKKMGGEGRIVKIVYVVMDNEEDIQFLHKCDLGNLTTKEL